MAPGRIRKVSGPLVIGDQMKGARMFDMVRVGTQKLIGEIIALQQELASIQVYEETYGLQTGEPIYLTEAPLSVELGPGLMGAIFDGIQRPLEKMCTTHGHYIARGIMIEALDREKRWPFCPLKKCGDIVEPGDILGEVQESCTINHKILVPIGVSGTIEFIHEGDFTIVEPIAKIATPQGDNFIKMLQTWPIRRPRPYKKKLFCDEMLITGQRVIDALFPIAKGGTACIPGPFGSGKTVRATPIG